MRTWYENEELLRRFRECLARTDAEIQQLDGTESAAVSSQEEAPPVGLFQLVEAFTALRHELKLQTKSTRSLEDAVDQALAGLNRAVEQYRVLRSQEDMAAERAMRPLVEALIELDEALRRGARAIEATERQMIDEAPRRLEQALDERFAQLSVWKRRRSRAWHAEVQRQCREHAAETLSPVFAALRQGYDLICGRMNRILARHQIARLDCLGQPVDPERMNVVELVDVPQAEAGTVVEVVRPGYLWRERVVRYAEVRAARPRQS
jgi:molecular chaperone GrpE